MGEQGKFERFFFFFQTGSVVVNTTGFVVVLAVGPTVDAFLRPAQFALRQPQHSENVPRLSVFTVRHVFVRFRRHLPVHRRNDSQDAHSRPIESMYKKKNIYIYRRQAFDLYNLSLSLVREKRRI